MSTKVKTHFWLARHGETEWNCIKKLQGNLDSPLSETGVLQAHSLARAITLLNIELIISSPLGRALKTAQICQQANQLELKTEPLLSERDFGDWQGKLFNDLKGERYFQSVFFQVTNDCPPNGESGLNCRQRISQALVDIAHQYQQINILLVTHGDAIRCFTTQLSNDDYCDAYSQYGNGKLFPITYDHQSGAFSNNDVHV